MADVYCRAESVIVLRLTIETCPFFSCSYKRAFCDSSFLSATHNNNKNISIILTVLIIIKNSPSSSSSRPNHRQQETAMANIAPNKPSAPDPEKDLVDTPAMNLDACESTPKRTNSHGHKQ
jgi:hypothetical protein